MVFSLLVLSAPTNGQGAAAALRFAQAALAAGHRLRQVFFHADAVAAAVRVEAPRDEPQFDAAWAALAPRHGVPLLACETALARRGLDAVGMAHGAVTPGTLGQFMLALGDCDRVISFAG
jgi:tRNA 2-thiouridine synthesizing protein D